LHNWIRKGWFPPPIVLNVGVAGEIVAWRLSDIEAWTASRPQRLAMPVSAKAYEARRERARQKRQAAEPVAVSRPRLQRPTS
jgi:hypothetical protein